MDRSKEDGQLCQSVLLPSAVARCARITFTRIPFAAALNCTCAGTLSSLTLTNKSTIRLSVGNSRAPVRTASVITHHGPDHCPSAHMFGIGPRSFGGHAISPAEK